MTLQDAIAEPAAALVAPDPSQAVRDLVAGFSIECTPASAGKIDSFAGLVPGGTEVYITFLPGTDPRDTVELARRLRRDGLEPVPHVPARSLANEAALEEYLRQMTGEAGVTRVLAIAGAPALPIGDYSDTLQILSTGLFEKYGIARIGVAGHPESCPDCTDRTLLEALLWKNAYAAESDAELHIVTQFCFEARPLIAYEALLRREGITLPVHVGLPGIATLKTLLHFAVTCGVGNSVTFLRRQAQNVTRLLKPHAPDRLVVDLARHVAATPGSAFARMHFFPLGGFLRSAAWANAVADGRFEETPDGGLSVEV